MLVDSHCHLNFPELSDHENIIKRAGEMGVSHMQTICTQMSEFDEILAIADKYTNVYASVGVHPNHAHENPLITADELIEKAQHKKVIGFGETGLDYFRNREFKDLQIASFKNHIKAAKATGLPIIVHSRDAEADTLDLIAAELKEQYFPFLIHCFSASVEFGERALSMGGYISFSGIVTFKNAVSVQSMAKITPLERMLVETDAPFLAPNPERGKVNEPAFTRHTAKFIAALKKLDFHEFSEITTGNFFNLFGKAKFL